MRLATSLGAVAADRFDRATFHRFFAKRFFLGRLGLFINEGMAAVVVALEIGRARFRGRDRSRCIGHRRRIFHLRFRHICLRRQP